MTQTDLEILLKDLQALPKECEWVEFKSNNRAPEKIGELLSALINGANYKRQPYGYLVYGIEDSTHRLIGTTFNPILAKTDGGQELENWLVCNLNPRVDLNLYHFEFEGLRFSIFKVQSTSFRPVTFKQQAYIRIGSYTKKLGDHPEREKAIWSQGGSYAFEKEISLYQITPKAVLQYIDYKSFFSLTNTPVPLSDKSILDKLTQEKILIKNGINYDITNLGAILFARDLNNFEDLKRKAVRVIFYRGNDKMNTVREQIGIKGYAAGFSGLLNYLEERLPSNEVMEKALRRVVTEYPILAIRELIANALIHQDFGVRGSSPMIEIYSNRIEITNPGSPLIDVDRFIDHSPQSRNEILAGFMRRLAICEERGSGFDKVVLLCEINQLPPPQIIVGDSYTRIILYGIQSFKKMDKKDKIRGCYLHACLKYVTGELMTNQTVRDRFGITEENYPMASKIISDTIEAEFIKVYDPSSNSRKYAKYVPYWV
jgi:ATP-dependent DNA helicase RecG